MESEEIRDRRPIKARQTRWATSAARQLQRRGATPNGISVAGSVCALFAEGGLCSPAGADLRKEHKG
ncbi:hypothetical protein ACVWYD_003078 [Morganella morganii]